MRKFARPCAALLAWSLLSFGCQQQQGQHGFDYAHVTDDGTLQQRAAEPLTPPSVIYVQDFNLGSTQLESDPGVVSNVLENRPRLIARPSESGTTQQKLDYWSNLLAESIVTDLNAKGLDAQRLTSAEAIPKSGWRVSGEVLKVEEGNRMLRSMVGFGAGASDSTLYVAVTDLSRPDGSAVEAFNVDSSTGHGPGAVVMPSPYAAIAKFVLAGNATDADFKRAATEITNEIEKAVKLAQVRAASSSESAPGTP